MLTLGELLAVVLKYCSENPYPISDVVYGVKASGDNSFVIIESPRGDIEIPIQADGR